MLKCLKKISGSNNIPHKSFIMMIALFAKETTARLMYMTRKKVDL